MDGIAVDSVERLAAAAFEAGRAAGRMERACEEYAAAKRRLAAAREALFPASPSNP